MALETIDNVAAGMATEAQVTPVDPTADAQPVVKEPEKVPEKPATEAQDAKTAARFAAIARRDREQREREGKLKHLEGIEKLAKESPLKALETLGLTYDQITDLILSQGEPPKAEDKIAALERRMQEKEAAEAAREAAAAEQAKTATIDGFKRLITEKVTAAGDQYELINALGQHDEIFELIEQNYERTTVKDDSGRIVKPGKLLSIEEAAQLVEDHLTEDTKKRLGLKKFAPAPGTTAPASNGNVRGEKSGITLTNHIGSEVADSDDELPMDPKERTAAILRRMNFGG